MNNMAPLSARSIWFGFRFTCSICDSSPAIADEVLKSIGVVRAEVDSFVGAREVSLLDVAGTLLDNNLEIFLDFRYCRLKDAADRRRTTVDEVMVFLLSYLDANNDHSFCSRSFCRLSFTVLTSLLKTRCEIASFEKFFPIDARLFYCNFLSSLSSLSIFFGKACKACQVEASFHQIENRRNYNSLFEYKVQTN